MAQKKKVAGLERPTKQVNIYLMRHGQTDGNIGNRLDGTTDTPLNHTGRGQAVVASKEVAKLKLDHIFCSDLSRACETAEIVNKMSGKNLDITVDKRLREVHFGDLEGKPMPELEKIILAECDPKVKDMNWKNDEVFWYYLQDKPRHNIESLDQMFDRAKAFIDDIIAKRLGNVLIVCHGAIMLPILHYARHKTLDKKDFIATEAQLVIANTEIIRWE